LNLRGIKALKGISKGIVLKEINVELLSKIKMKN